MEKETTKTVGTPAATWRVNGEPDPHGEYYNGESGRLAMADTPDKVLAELVGASHRQILTIGILTAAKERIRWLSRRVFELEGDNETTCLEREQLPMGNYTDDVMANAVFMYGDSPNPDDKPLDHLLAGKERIIWLTNKLASLVKDSAVK